MMIFWILFRYDTEKDFYDCAKNLTFVELEHMSKSEVNVIKPQTLYAGLVHHK